MSNYAPSPQFDLQQFGGMGSKAHGIVNGTNRNPDPHKPIQLQYTPQAYLAPFWRTTHLLQMDGHRYLSNRRNRRTAALPRIWRQYVLTL